MGIHDKPTRKFFESNVLVGSWQPPPPSVKLEGLTDILYPIATFIDGDLDVDKIDYVARDNYHCGFPYELDWSRVDKNIHVQKQGGKESNRYQLAFGKEALFFLTSVIRERYNFGYHVHNESWNIFIERNIIPKLKMFLEEYNYKDYRYKDSRKMVSQKILDMHTKWQDGDLRFYLQDFEDYLSGDNSRRGIKKVLYPNYKKEWKPTSFKKLLAKDLTLSEEKNEQNAAQVTTVREDARIHIPFDEMTPPVRKMVHVLLQPQMRSNGDSKQCLDKIEQYFDDTYASGERVFVVYFYRVRPLKFTALIHNKENSVNEDNTTHNGPESYYILDNQIIRGIMNESLKQFGVCVLGTKDIAVSNAEVSACKNCGMYTGEKAPIDEDTPDQPNYHLCIKGYTAKQKVLLNQIILSYRDFCVVCAKNHKIIFSDFILEVLHQLQKYIKRTHGDIYDTSVDVVTLYKTCKEIADALGKEIACKFGEEYGDIIFGKAKFDKIADAGEPSKRVPYDFQQELRTCVYIGLIDARRNITKHGRYKPFSRSYSLSPWGERYFIALQSCDAIAKQYYEGYVKLLNEIRRIFDDDIQLGYREARKNIDGILTDWEKEYHKRIGIFKKHLEEIKSKNKD